MIRHGSNFARGLRDYWGANRLVFRQGLWKVIILPGFISLFYFPATIAATGFLFSGLADYAHDHWLPEEIQSRFTEILLWILLWLVSCATAFIFYRNIIMILYSPGMGYLSEKAESKAYGLEEPKFTWKGLGHNILRGVSVSLVTLAFSIVVLAACYLMALIPVIGVFFSVVMIPLSQMFFAGIGFADPALERRKYSVRRTLSFARRNPWRLAGHGAGFMALLAIPIAGWFLAPSYGIIAGTLGAADVIHGREAAANAAE